jgi:hypothetical protein
MRPPLGSGVWESSENTIRRDLVGSLYVGKAPGRINVSIKRPNRNRRSAIHRGQQSADGVHRDSI